MYKVADLWNGNPDRGDKYKRAIMKAVSLGGGSLEEPISHRQTIRAAHYTYVFSRIPHRKYITRLTKDFAWLIINKTECKVSPTSSL